MGSALVPLGSCPVAAAGLQASHLCSWDGEWGGLARELALSFPEKSRVLGSRQLPRPQPGYNWNPEDCSHRACWEVDC